MIPYIEGSGELAIFSASLVGAGLGFLWFNSYPAEIFMGDCGSLSLGSSLGLLANYLKTGTCICHHERNFYCRSFVGNPSSIVI